MALRNYLLQPRICEKRDDDELQEMLSPMMAHACMIFVRWNTARTRNGMTPSRESGDVCQCMIE